MHGWIFHNNLNKMHLENCRFVDFLLKLVDLLFLGILRNSLVHKNLNCTQNIILEWNVHHKLCTVYGYINTAKCDYLCVKLNATIQTNTFV